MSIQYSAYDTAIRATTSLFQGHLQVQAKGYVDNPHINTIIPAVTSVRDRVVSAPGVATAASRAIGFALISSAERTLSAQMVGIQPLLEGGVSTIPSLVKEGRFVNETDHESVVVGAALARNLKIDIGSEVTLLGQGRSGAMAAAVLTVVGIFESGSRDLDRSLAYIPLSIFQDIFSMGDAGHSVVVAAKSIEHIDELRDEIESRLGPLTKTLAVLTWEQINPGLRQSIDLDLAFGRLFYLCLLVIVTFGVLNTFLMTIMERTREFGLLMALGMTPRALTALILCECLFLLGCGLFPGIAIGSALVSYFHEHGFYIPGSEEIMRMWNIPGAVFPEISVASISQGPLVLIIFGLLAVLIPTRRLRKLDPVEAMRAV